MQLAQKGVQSLPDPDSMIVEWTKPSQ